MAFFTKEYFKFFSELEKNNNKVWFDANRSRYEEFLKKMKVINNSPSKDAILNLANGVRGLK